MIGRIRGTLLEKAPPRLLVEAGGLGYELEAPMSTFYDLPQTGQPVTLLVHMVVREDAQLLFGFGSRAERELFRSLLKVNGVGARVALAILSGMSVAEFHGCIQARDAAALTRVPGIGKKTAERLVLELSDKLQQTGSTTSGTSALPSSLQQGVENPRVQAQAALESLGYKAADARKLLERIDAAADAGVEDLIRAALQQVNNR